MKNRLFFSFLGMVALLFTMTGCDSANTEEEVATILTRTEVRSMAVSVSSELGLSTTKTAKVVGTFDHHADKQPGFLWLVADSLQKTLTAEEKEKLLTPVNDAVGNHDRGHHGPGPHLGKGGRGEKGMSQLVPWDLLTDAQKAQVEAIRAKYEPQIRTLMQSRNTLTAAEFEAQMTALRTAMQDEINAILTDEQKAEIAARLADAQAAMEAFLAAEKETRNTVLGLSATQSDQLDAAYKALLDGTKALLDEVKAGTKTKDEIPAAIEALRATFDASLATFLNATQIEVVKIHDALLHRKPGKGGKGGPGKGGQG